VHNVLIKFPDRKQPQAPHTPHPHPSAPREIKETFNEFLKKIEVSSSDPAQGLGKHESAASRKQGQGTAPNFWEEGVSRYWNPIPLEEWEIEAVESGGATVLPRK